MSLQQSVAYKRNQWAREALIFNAMHGQKNGEFFARKWANGEIMVGPENALSNQMIPLEQFNILKANNWLIFVD